MVLCVTIGWPHDPKKDPKIILGPAADAHEHSAKLKQLRASRINDEFARVEILSNNGGHINFAKFITTKEAEERKKNIAAQEEIFRKAQEEREKKEKGQQDSEPEDSAKKKSK